MELSNASTGNRSGDRHHLRVQRSKLDLSIQFPIQARELAVLARRCDLTLGWHSIVVPCNGSTLRT